LGLSRPTFSIIITSFTQQAFITDAVNSALRFRDDVAEIIVVDDASTDGSQAVLAGYGEVIVFVALSSNVGKGRARNVGAKRATGEYVIFLDGDDVLLPWAFQVCERVAAARRPQLILCPMRWFKGELPASPVESPSSVEFVEYDDYMHKDRSFGVSASSVVFAREAFEQVGGWSDLAVMQDQDMVFRTGDIGPVVHVLSPPTTLHRSHAGQSVQRVSPFLEVLYGMIEREQRGEYPGGAARKFDRAVLFGGLILFWTQRAFKAGLYRDSARLLISGWKMAAAALIQRTRVKLSGQRIPQTFDL
jgi:glycosyltransferase involved in cell wall biosynthesis